MRIFFFNLLALIFSVNNLYSQSEFDRGYKVGYAEGYCYQQGIGCIAPFPPMTPMPNLNESYNNYKDGYNRGFLDGNNGSKKSPTTSPYGRKSYTPVYKPFKPDFEQLQMILQARQQQLINNYNNSYSHPTSNKGVTLYDYLVTAFPNTEFAKFRINLSDFNSQTRHAIQAKQLYSSFSSYPILIDEGSYKACAIVFDSNRNVLFVDNEAYVSIGTERLVDFILFSEAAKNHTAIMKYNQDVKAAMEKYSLSNDPLAINYVWNLISYQQKSYHCLSEILVQPFDSNSNKKGDEYNVILLFNDVLQKYKNSQQRN